MGHNVIMHYSDTITHRTRCVRTPIYIIIQIKSLVRFSLKQFHWDKNVCGVRVCVCDKTYRRRRSLFFFLFFFYRFCVPIPFSKRRPPHQLTELALKKQSYCTQSHESDTRFSSDPRQRLLLLLYRNFFFRFIYPPNKQFCARIKCSYT